MDPATPITPLLPILLTIGLLLVCGLLLGIAASRLGLPRMIGYISAGIIFSPDLLGGIAGLQVGHWVASMTTGALGIIAFLIGGSVTVAQLRRMGAVILGTALGSSLGAVLLVFIGMVLVAPSTDTVSGAALALAFAAISATTAPAGTVAVVHQYRARGPVTTTLLGAVAVDDVLGIVYFALIMALVVGDSLTLGLGIALLEIVGALALGWLSGWLLAFAGSHIRQANLRMPLILGCVLAVTGLAQFAQVSPLLAAMSLGFSVRFFMRAAGSRLFIPVEFFEEVIFITFFTLAGAHFDFDVFRNYALLCIVYFVTRSLGKVSGAMIGARLTGAPDQIVRWAGTGLLPQAGVAVGLALTLSHVPAFQSVSTIVVNVILANTIAFEFFGPLMTRFALRRAGELGIVRRRVQS